MTSETTEFSGQLSVVLFSELILNLANRDHTGTILIEGSEGSGSVWMKSGVLLDARCGALEGQAAFYRFCRQRAGKFTVSHSAIDRPRRIRDSLPILLSRRACLETDWSALPSKVVSLDATVAINPEAVPSQRLEGRPQESKLFSLLRAPRRVVDVVEESDNVVGALVTLTTWIEAGILNVEADHGSVQHQDDAPPSGAPQTVRVSSRAPALDARRTVRVPLAELGRNGSSAPALAARGTVVVRPADAGASNATVPPAAEPPPSSENNEPLAPYAFLGRYQVISRLGRGSMGSVYLARLEGDGGFTRHVAIKVLRSSLYRSPQAIGMLMNEARIAARMQHRNVISVLDVGNHKGQPYLVMDYIRGATLERLLSRCPTLATPDRVVPIIVDCLAGLHAIHELQDDQGQSARVIHNDISPRNVLVGVDGVGRLTDFGVANIKHGASTAGEHMYGTAPYLAPERLQGIVGDARSDIYSVGVMLWLALTGAPLREPEALARVLFEGASKRPRAPSQVGRRPPVCLDEICLRALAPEPAARYQTAEAMLTELQRVAVHNNLLAASSAITGWVSEVLALDGDLPPASRPASSRPLPEPIPEPHGAPPPSEPAASRSSPLEALPAGPALPPLPELGPPGALRQMPTVMMPRVERSRARFIAKWVAVVLALVALAFAIAGPELIADGPAPATRSGR